MYVNVKVVLGCSVCGVWAWGVEGEGSPHWEGDCVRDTGPPGPSPGPASCERPTPIRSWATPGATPHLVTLAPSLFCPQDLRMNSTKSLIGHVLGGASGVEAVATIKALQTGGCMFLCMHYARLR